MYGKEKPSNPSMQTTFSNIILIGMAGAGKSTIGPQLARLSGKNFIDSDTLIAEQTGMRLQEYLDQTGISKFQQQEEQALLSIAVNNHVIATGGSAIYSNIGMAHLKKSGRIVLLNVTKETLQQRVNNPHSRGLVNPDGGSLQDLFLSRRPLYEHWADLIINATTGSPSAIAQSIWIQLKKLEQE